MKAIIGIILFCSSFLLNAQKDSTQLNVAIFLYPGVELLDFAGPLEVFANTKDFKVFTVAADSGRIYSMRNSLNIQPDYTIKSAPTVDVLVIPGAGESLMAAVNQKATISWIKAVHEKAKISMSVCTGAAFFAQAGILDGKKATTHWGATHAIQTFAPKSTILEDTRFVLDGKLLTTAGVSAGLDGALFLVSELRGLPEAKKIARAIEYDKWDPNSGFIVGKSAMKPVKKTEKVLDPICRMKLTPEDIFVTKTYGNQSVSFCSAHCQEIYEEGLKVKK